ncbi:TIR domain-containing protein [Pacificimonas sp. WHA3]|uniref:TIR domain-containing protein n=1 Tax=Pacificimonas pallii TaxID=2827236 RepID=A0ABS6SBR5_9SPHN|nr:TIR domain-containing protein [Pacificimonas pallii]MBV7255854.1 TIR domain-containing protein [Pacificimonas pallii]
MTGADPESGESAPAKTVFLSYARVDREQALPIVAAIEAAGYGVWWDGLIEGGERFLETIETALVSAKAVVVLWSEASVKSSWVRDEATHGFENGNLVPVALGGTVPPLGFRQAQSIDVNDARSADAAPAMEAILRAIAARHGDGETTAAEAVMPHTGPPDKTIAAGSIDRRALLGGTALLLSAGAVGAWWLTQSGPQAATDNSVAILPFANLSGNPEKSYLSDGLSAELRTQLSSNRLLRVAAQTSSNSFRGSDEDARTICSRLGVSFLLDGNVRLAGDMLRISAELIDGRTGFSQWSETFDRSVQNIFAVQEEIARAVTLALTQEMLGGKQADFTMAGGTDSLAAYDAYLRGRDHYARASDRSDDMAALASFDAAIAADEDFALAHAARARSLTVIGNQYDQGQERRSRYRDAIAAARRAAALAPDVADTQSALGFALFNGDIDAAGARAPYERSFELGGGDADVLSRYALYSARCGRFDSARAAIARAAELDPLNARVFRRIGEVEYSARAYAASIPPVQRALGLNPELSVAHSAIGASLYLMGDVPGARTAYEREPSSLFRLTGLAIVAERQDRTADAEAAFAALGAAHGDNSLYQRAQVLAQWGRADDAMDLLETAREEGDAGLVYLRNDPFLDPLRQRLDFIRLLTALGFA